MPDSPQSLLAPFASRADPEANPPAKRPLVEVVTWAGMALLGFPPLAQDTWQASSSRGGVRGSRGQGGSDGLLPHLIKYPDPESRLYDSATYICSQAQHLHTA